MGSTLLYHSDDDTKIKTDINFIRSVLASGYSVEMNAEGYSMFPAILPGCRVVIRPLATGEVPAVGCVVVFTEEATKEPGNESTGLISNTVKSRLILHRLIKITDNTPDNLQFITQGDSLILPDKPVIRDQIIGVAESYKKGIKEYSIVSFIPAAWRYKFNRRLLWGYFRIMVVFKKLGAWCWVLVWCLVLGAGWVLVRTKFIILHHV